MRNLFLVDGAAGAGKSDLLSYIKQTYTGQLATIVKKYSTRKQRPWEEESPADLTIVPEDAFAPYRDPKEYYGYRYGEGEYAISKNDLRSLVMEYVNTFLVARSREVIRVLMADYHDAARVIPIFVYSDPHAIEERMNTKEKELRDSGKDALADLFHKHIAERLARSEDLWKDYLREPFLYHHVLINNFERKDYESLIEKLLDKYAI